MHAGMHPPRADTPQTRPPWEQTPPRSRHPPWEEADSSIWSMSGWYASYWNAFLLDLILLKSTVTMRIRLRGAVSFQVELNIITVHNRSCGKVMFSQVWVKNYVHRGGVCPIACWDTRTPGHTHTHTSWTHTPRPPPTPTPEMATALDDTHPTGMHSCGYINSLSHSQILNFY